MNVVDFPELPALVHYVRQRRCALFVGAGLSLAAGLPTWRQLMERLIPAATPFAATRKRLQSMERRARAVAAANPDLANPLSQPQIQRLFTTVLGAKRARSLFDLEIGGINILNYNAYQEALERVRRESAIAVELERLLAAGKFPELAGYCRDLLGRSEFHERVRRELRPTKRTPDTHRAIVRTPFSCVVTTNFDTLLEDSYAQWDSRGVPKAPTGAELSEQGTLLFDGAFFILKAHGDLYDDSSIIFTSEDYRRVIHSNPAFQAMLTGILLQHAVLFVGYSLSDPNFRLLLDNQLTIFNEQVPPRYALMEGVGEAEREILWRTAKLRVFSYEAGKYDVVSRFLQTLANRTSTAAAVVTPASAAPAASRTLLRRPVPMDVFELAAAGSGDRIILHLHEQRPGGASHRIWSGGCQWPEWPLIRHALRKVLSNVDATLPEVSAFGAQLQRVLPDELLRHLDATSSKMPIMLSLSPSTETLPWEWLIVDGSPLCLRNPVVRRPTNVSDKARGLPLTGYPLRALIVATSGIGNKSNLGKLPGAAEEAQRITRLLREVGHHVTLLEGEDAIYAQLVAEVEGGDYDIVHFAGHAWFEGSEGLLYLWDGRVSSSELASILNRRPPALLVLNSHFTAFAPPGALVENYRDAQSTTPPGVDRPLPPPLGFMGLASHSGVGAFVGCFSGAVRDDSAARFTIELYRDLLRQKPFVQALHGARRATTNFNDITGLCYAGSGYPEMTLAQATGRDRA